MPRKFVVRILEYPPLREGVVFALRLVSIGRSADGLSAVFEHVDAEHAGRRHTVVLPAPIVPASMAATLFRAAGLDAVAGKCVAPGDAVGRIVGCRFRKTAGGEWEVSNFEAIRAQPDASLTSKPAGPLAVVDPSRMDVKS